MFTINSGADLNCGVHRMAFATISKILAAIVVRFKAVCFQSNRVQYISFIYFIIYLNIKKLSMYTYRMYIYVHILIKFKGFSNIYLYAMWVGI